VGVQSGNTDFLMQVREMGAQFMICGSESSMLLESYRSTLSRMKA
jgi:hypothetical protein